MKIKDLIEELQKQNPENKVEFRVLPATSNVRFVRCEECGSKMFPVSERVQLERTIEHGSTTEIQLR